MWLQGVENAFMLSNCVCYKTDSFTSLESSVSVGKAVDRLMLANRSEPMMNFIILKV